MDFSSIYSLIYFLIFLFMMVIGVLDNFVDYHEYHLLKRKKEDKIKFVYFYDVLKRKYLTITHRGLDLTSSPTTFTQKYKDGIKYYEQGSMPKTKFFLMKEGGELTVQENKKPVEFIEGFFITKKTTTEHHSKKEKEKEKEKVKENREERRWEKRERRGEKEFRRGKEGGRSRERDTSHRYTSRNRSREIRYD